MLAIEEHNPDYRGLYDLTEFDYSAEFYDRRVVQYKIGYKVSFKRPTLIGELCSFVYNERAYYGKVIHQDPISQILTIEGCSYDEMLIEIEKLNEAFDYAI